MKYSTNIISKISSFLDQVWNLSLSYANDQIIAF